MCRTTNKSEWEWMYATRIETESACKKQTKSRRRPSELGCVCEMHVHPTLCHFTASGWPGVSCAVRDSGNRRVYKQACHRYLKHAFKDF